MSAIPPATHADWPSAPPGNGHRPGRRDPALIPFDEPLDDGPTVRLHDDPPPDSARPAKPKAPRRGKWVVFAVLLAVFAMLAAGYAVWLGRRALDQAADARAFVTGPPAAAPDTASGSSGGADAPPAADPPAGDVPGDATVLIEPSAAAAPSAPPTEPAASPDAAPPPGSVRYAGKRLPVKAGCAAAVYLDLDEPRAVPAAAGPDVGTGCAGTASTLRLGPGAGAGTLLRGSSAERGASPTAATCEQRLLADPLEPGAVIPLREGAVLCIRTGREGEPGSVVLLQVGAADAQGNLTLRASSWASD